MRFSFKQNVLFIIFLATAVQCKKTNWNENYREREKSPFGTYIIYNETKNLFEDADVTYLKKNIYDYLTDNYMEEDSNCANYICIKNNAGRLNQQGLNKLLQFVENGNNAFLALNYFSSELKETLGFKIENPDDISLDTETLNSFEGKLTLVNKGFKETEFYYDRNLQKAYFSDFDSNVTVLGNQKINGKEKPIFIKINHGKGIVFLHCNPIAFTNYYLLKKPNYQYVENVFSYLPDMSVILWDPLVKKSNSNNNNNNYNDETSIFRFFLKHPSLKWSLFVGFAGLLLFMLFNARRKQRPIPIIKKLKNSTVEFTHTIANLYLKEKNHKNLVAKKITFFLQKVRTKYLLDTQNLNKDFIEKLSLKSGNELQKTNYLINTIISLNNKSECSQDELFRLNILIDNFFENN